MSFNAGAITSTLGIDLSGYTQGMLQATSIASLFPATVTNFMANPLLGVIGIAKTAAGAIASAFEGITDVFVSFGREMDNIAEQAEKVGVSADFLNTVGRAAADAGGSIAALADGMKFLNNNAADAANGAEEAIKAFDKIGVTVEDGNGNIKRTEDLFYEVADAISKLPAEALKTDAAIKLLGRGGNDLIPLINQGSSAIKGMADEIRLLEGTITKELTEAGDKWGKLEIYVGSAWKGIKRAVSEPILTFVADHFEEIKKVIFETVASIKESLKKVDWDNFLNRGLKLFEKLGDVLKKTDWGSALNGLLAIGEALEDVSEKLLKLLTRIDQVKGAWKDFNDLLPEVPRAAKGDSFLNKLGFEEIGGTTYTEQKAGESPRSSSGNSTIQVTVAPTDSTGQIADAIRQAIAGLNRRGESEAREYNRNLRDALAGVENA